MTDPPEPRVPADAEHPAQHRAAVLGVARGGGLNVAGTAFTQGVRFGITLLLARLLGRDEVGLYYQAFAFLALLSLVCSGGFSAALTRYVALHRAAGDRAALRGTLRLGIAVPTALATVAAVGLYAASGWLARTAFHEPALAWPLRLMAAALPATVLTDAALAATRGFRTMRPYAAVNLVFEPAFRLALTVALLAAGYGLTGAIVAIPVTNGLAAALAALALRRLAGRLRERPSYDTRELLGFSALTQASVLASNGLVWADTILLGLFVTTAEVGVYQVATRLVLAAIVFMGPLNTAFAPQITDLHRRGRSDELRRTYALVTSWSLRLSLPVFAALFLFPDEALRVFGPGFAAGATVTVLLAAGQLVNVASGPSGSMLVMSGRPGVTMTNNILALVANVGLNLFLIPRYGLLGAGVAWTISVVLVSLARVVEVWSAMRMLPVDRDTWKGFAAAAAGFAAGYAVDRATAGLTALVAGVAAIGLVYLATLTALGIGADDRLVLRTMWRRRPWVRPS